MFETTPEEKDLKEEEIEEESRPKRKGGDEEKRDSFFGDLIRFSLISVLIVIPIRLFIASPFVVNGSSMDPTFTTGQYLIVDQLSYKLSEPKRGDVIIFHYPKDPSKFFIKRVIGLPGETVVIKGSAVRIINDEHPDGFVLDEPFLAHISKDNDSEFKLSDDEYVVLGDNRPASSDSRSWGTVNEKLIVGRALVRLYPLNTIGFLPGEEKLEDNK